MIELMHYWNRASDKYVILANKKTIVRNQPNMYAHKELPFVVRQYSHNPFSIYGR